MKPALAHTLTQLHSREWRVRYGEEFEALLLDMPATPAIVLNAVESACSSQRRLFLLGCAALAIAVFLPFGPAQQHAGLAARIPQRHRYITQVQLHELPPCAVYSSVARNRWPQRKQCLS
jgi:hypothetical protein